MIRSFSGEYRFLSNFIGGVEYLYQASKATNPEDRERIMAAGSPGKAKRLARHILLRPDWEEVKVGIMYNLLVQKFSDWQAGYGLLLLQTGTQPIIEGNTWHDNFWGSCSCPKCRPGLNWMGRLLMLRRSVLAVERKA